MAAGRPVKRPIGCKMVVAWTKVEVVELQESGWFGKCNVYLLYYLRIHNSSIKKKKNK